MKIMQTNRESRLLQSVYNIIKEKETVDNTKPQP